MLEGRRIYFVGIGGAGLSGYAFLARAWGAEVAGWDVRETPYLRTLDDVHVDLGDEPRPPDGWEVVVSTAHRTRARGTSRAEFLAELVSLRDAIVVAGAHGKTTTTAMIAFVLRELGRDPAWLIGGEVPQLGRNASAGSGWLVVEGDESDRTVERLGASIAVVTNIELDHHAEYASEAEVAELLERWLEAAPVLARFEGVGRRFQVVGEAGGVTVVDDYAHHPSEIAATIAAARERGGARVLVLFQPHLYSRTRHLAAELGAALSAADAVCVTDVYPAREEPVAGVDGLLVVRTLAPTTRRRERRPRRSAPSPPARRARACARPAGRRRRRPAPRAPDRRP